MKRRRRQVAILLLVGLTGMAIVVAVRYGRVRRIEAQAGELRQHLCRSWGFPAPASHPTDWEAAHHGGYHHWFTPALGPDDDPYRVGVEVSCTWLTRDWQGPRVRSLLIGPETRIAEAAATEAGDDHALHARLLVAKGFGVPLERVGAAEPRDPPTRWPEYLVRLPNGPDYVGDQCMVLVVPFGHHSLTTPGQPAAHQPKAPAAP